MAESIINPVVATVLAAALVGLATGMWKIIVMVHDLTVSNKKNTERISLMLVGSQVSAQGTLAALEAIKDGHCNGNVSSAMTDLISFQQRIFEHLAKEGIC